ncbi:hypothetical protein [Actinomarinicola tropica]|uniref:Uncharacterized protein n=1 Tax=Actinomarinicola tropica TaxID=2789776 RepID=A0A5Q2RKX0_9ACTN|nr:hypothetical protein [Actinomarinicola tropica]QGG95076.1 hypothetical protein GH723_08135 [Actinomarinicola tropica]
MSDATTPDPSDEAVASRAELLPEEQAAGSDDPEAQAEAILTESEERAADRGAAPSTHLEERTSEEVTEDPSPPA